MNELTKNIKIKMIEKGVSQVDLIKEYGFDKGDLSKVVHGKRKTRKIRVAIANKLGLEYNDLFPDGFHLEPPLEE
jgi:lambda repressor-like predicted transcriptional regulator